MRTGFVALHEQTREYAYPLNRTELAVRMRVGAGACKSCALVYWNRNKPEEGTRELSMARFASDGMLDYFEAVVKTSEATRYLQYYFRLDTGKKIFWLSYYGIQNEKPESGFFEYSYTNDGDVSIPPVWPCESVFYQIFPDRFFNGDPSNDPEGTLPWGSAPAREGFMGGDLKGIAKKLPYLADLGIRAIYLNPIFLSPSNHKYDTVDYMQIDPAFGTAEDLARLVSACHEKGIRVILDGVFNHCGYYVPMFLDVLEKGENSPYSGWFYIDEYPVDDVKLNYETIGYYRLMPKLRLSDEAAREYILKAARHWMEYAHIDGWRLDCAEEVERPFWQIFRRSMKAVKDDCFLLAETWRENVDLVRGDQMDSVTNYPLRNAMLEFFAKGTIGASEFDRRINRIVGAYPEPVLKALFTVIDSHDTERFLTSCGGDVRKMKMAVAFQFGFPGIPSIYYGDEIGMEGDMDPACRRCMNWIREEWNTELCDWYQKLIDLRNRLKALQLGTYTTVYVGKENNVLSYIREFRNQKIQFILNNSSQKTIAQVPVVSDKRDVRFLEISGESFPLQQDPIDLYGANEQNGGGFQVSELSLKPYEILIIF